MRSQKLIQLVTALRQANNTAFIGSIADQMYDKTYMTDSDIENELRRKVSQLRKVKEIAPGNACGSLTKNEKKLLAKLEEAGF